MEAKVCGQCGRRHLREGAFIVIGELILCGGCYSSHIQRASFQPPKQVPQQKAA